METKHLEYNKIRQVAKDYEKKGYNVIVEPKGSSIPQFIKGYSPDIIATSESDNVVIEVKTRSNFSTIERLRDIADTINKMHNWRFELIVTSSKDESQIDSNKLNIDLNLSEIAKRLDEVKIVLDQSLYAAAFILCWGIFESLARQLLLEDNKKMTNKTSLVLIKTLFSFGYLTRTDYESLEKFFFIRNQIVHGYKIYELDKRTSERLITITEKLLRVKNS